MRRRLTTDMDFTGYEVGDSEITLRDYQEEAVNSAWAYMRKTKAGKNPLIVAPTGCHEIDTPILMSDGSIKKVQDVVPGDCLMGPDSGPRTVLHLCRGREQMYRVTPVKGEPFTVNEGHVLHLIHTQTGQTVDVSVGDYLARSRNFRHLHKLHRPSIVSFPGRNTPMIDPWLMGALLGDGSLQRGVAITSMDQEIQDRFAEHVASHGCHVRVGIKEGNRAWTSHAVTPRGQSNPMLEEVERLGLRVTCGEKFIPDEYLLSSPTCRRSLLAGLLDTDGHLNNRGFDFISKSNTLSMGVVFLCRSLGLQATISECQKSCQGGFTGNYWRVCISGDLSSIPFVRLRHQGIQPRRQTKSPLRTGFSVESVGQGDFYGFTLSGDHLYLTGDLLIHHNSGKSMINAAICHEAWKMHPGTRIIMLTHVQELVEQNEKALLRYWPDAPVGVFSAGLGRKEPKSPILFGGVQSVCRAVDQIGYADFIIVDEAHLIPKSGNGQYLQAIEAFRSMNPGIRVIGLTATPFRTDSGYLHRGDGRLFDDVCFDIPILDLMDRGHICRLTSKGGGSARISTEGVDRAGGDYNGRQLQIRAMEGDSVSRAVEDIISRSAGRRGWLAFASGKQHAEMIRDEFRDRGVTCEMILGDTPKGERSRLLKDFKAMRIQCMVSVGVLTTGFDAPHVDLIAMLRPTISPGLHCLDAETEVLTSRGWLGPGEVKKGDTAAARDMESGRGVWSPVTGLVDRPMDPGESWVVYDSPRANFRVTDQHRMLFYTRKCKEMRVDTAEKMAALKDSVYMPTAVRIDQPGVPLTDDELYLIGIILTDGSVSTHQVTIYQSERYPEVMDRIEAALVGADIRFRKTRMRYETQFQENYPRWRFSISAGNPRDGVGRGIRWLYPWLSKDFSPSLMSLSRHQFMVLLDAMWDGDGTKKANVDYTPRSKQLCTARKSVADSMQALGAIHGFTVNSRKEQGQRRNPIYLVTFTDRNWRACGGVHAKRPQVHIQPATNERVWCVETGAGTIVTRRRGKVTVMGNCQMVGRGLRMCEGKSDGCLVLDYAGNIERHGPLDAIKVKEPGEGDGEAPMKECPGCQELVFAGKRECPACGHEFPPPELIKHEERPSTLAVVSNDERPEEEWIDVTATRFRRHRKPGKPDSVKISYEVGLGREINQWICPEHSPYNKATAGRFWSQHQGEAPPPESTDEWLDRSDELHMPCRIKVSNKGRFSNVTDREWREPGDEGTYPSPTAGANEPTDLGLDDLPF